MEPNTEEYTMATEINIDLNIDRVGPHDARVEVARLVLPRACGFTRDGGTPTMTEDCASYRALESEAQRLKVEIDDALRRARAHFGDDAVEAPAAPRSAARRAPAADRHHFDSGLRVRDVMTREVRTVNRNDQLSVADELMKLGRFRHVVVVDDSGAVAGVVSSRDLFYGALAWSLGLGQVAYERSLASYPVKQVMATDVVTLPPDADLREAAALISEKKIGCIPIVEAKKLVGIITEVDLLAILTS